MTRSQLARRASPLAVATGSGDAAAATRAAGQAGAATAAILAGAGLRLLPGAESPRW